MIETDPKFWAQVNIGKRGECWEWQGKRDKLGRGQVSKVSTDCYKWVHAHRAAYALANGSIPPGLCVCHHCDNPACCNPHHLYAGTMKQNCEDREKRGRGNQRGPRGERAPSSKLTEAQVLAIRERYAAGERSKVLAEEFGVRQMMVVYIVQGKNWAHVGGPRTFRGLGPVPKKREV